MLVMNQRYYYESSLQLQVVRRRWIRRTGRVQKRRRSSFVVVDWIDEVTRKKRTNHFSNRTSLNTRR